MTKRLEVGKDYWIKGKLTEDDRTNTPYCFEIADSPNYWFSENIEAVEVIPDREKVTLPRFMDDWMEGCKEHGYDLADTLDEGLNDSPKEVSKWLCNRKNQDTFARAWLDGYEVEKEPLYWVRDKNGYSLLYRDDSEVTKSCSTSVEYQKKTRGTYTFTEKEIKDYDERFWAFAEPVEEDDE